jgi:hypothetical protein
MFMRSAIAVCLRSRECQHFSPKDLEQPTITPQNTGTANGLIAV